MAARELVDHHMADVVSVARVLAARIAETDDEQVERRRAFAPSPGQAHGGLLLGVGLAGALAAGGGRLGGLALGLGLGALLAPETYMNESGRSVAAAASFFKVEPGAILVVHDESDLEAGRLQARMGGGLAGHNGLKSIAQSLGTQDFLRLRVGVGRPGRGDRRPLADWVLADFEPHEDPDAIVSRAADAVETLGDEGLEAAQRAFN